MAQQQAVLMLSPAFSDGRDTPVNTPSDGYPNLSHQEAIRAKQVSQGVLYPIIGTARISPPQSSVLCFMWLMCL